MVVDVNYFPSYAGIAGAASGLRDVIRAYTLPEVTQCTEAAG